MVFMSSEQEDDDATIATDEDLSEEDTDSGGSDTCNGLKKMFSQKIVCLLIFVPIAWGLKLLEHATGGEEGGVVKPVYNFIANFFSIIPLAWVISESTEHLEHKVGPMFGALLNQTFGNVVEILLSITLISKGKVKFVQSTLLGAIQMNLTLVLGLVFLVAGIQFHKRKFNRYQATYNLGMLSVASLALAVPTGLAVFDQWSTTKERLNISRWVAALLMAMYFQWLAFHLCTHNTMFDKKAAKKDSKEAHFFWATTQIGKQNSEYEMMAAQPKERGFAQLSARKDEDDEDEVTEDDDDEDEEGINLCCATTMLLGATVIVAFHCDFLVDALVPTCQEYGVKLAFVATVIFPMVGNFSEVIAAVSIARKGKLDLAMGVAIGSATQIALFVIPVVVFIAWFFEKPLDLDFEFFQDKILMIALFVVTLLILDGEANWLKGSLLITAYTIIATAFWFIHNREFESAGVPPDLVLENVSSLSAGNNTLVMEDRRLWG